MKGWASVLAGLAAVRLAIPLTALAAEGRDLPGFPRYDYEPLNGDATGFYAAVREFISAAGRLGAVRLALLVTGVAVTTWLAVRLRRRLGPLVLLAPVLACSLAVAAVIDEMHPTGAAVFGWSLLWSIPSFPLRALGLLDPDSAFVVGFVLSLAANAVTVVATAYAGFFATGRRSVGLGAAALFALWPLLTRPVVGERAWENGQWNVDTGLHLYTEPLSTALVATSLALLLAPRRSEGRATFVGALLGFSVAVKLSNVLVLALALPVLAARDGVRRALAAGAGAAAVAPVALAYWPKGYATPWNDPRAVSPDPFSAGYVVRSWTESLIFTPRMLLLLAPLLILGVLAVRNRFALVLLAGLVLTTAVFYSFFDFTRFHPRFLYVALPALFVLEAAGAVALASVRPAGSVSPR